MELLIAIVGMVSTLIGIIVTYTLAQSAEQRRQERDDRLHRQRDEREDRLETRRQDRDAIARLHNDRRLAYAHLLAAVENARNLIFRMRDGDAGAWEEEVYQALAEVDLVASGTAWKKARELDNFLYDWMVKKQTVQSIAKEGRSIYDSGGRWKEGSSPALDESSAAIVVMKARHAFMEAARIDLGIPEPSLDRTYLSIPPDDDETVPTSGETG
jgi:hypothetical protein